MKVAGYIHPLIPAQGPRSNFSGFETVARLLSALNRDAGSECVLITGSRFPLWAGGSRSRALLDGTRIVEIDEIALLRRLNDAGITPFALDELLNRPDAREHPAVAILGEEIARRCGAFTPDVLISFAVQTDFLAAHWPWTLRLHAEVGPFARNPFPFSLFFDHLGMHRRSAPGRLGERLRGFAASGEARSLAGAVRAHHARALRAADPFRSIDLRGRFERLCLLPLQVSNCFAFDGQCAYRTQLDFLLDVMSAAPADVGVVVTEYLECGQVLGHELDKDYLRRVFPNMIFLDQFRSYYSPSQYLVPRVDGVWSVSSSIGYQALLFDRMLGAPATSQFAGIAHATNLRDFFNRLPPRSDSEPTSTDRDAFVAWQLERYLVPDALLADGAWLHDYLTRRRDAMRGGADPIEAFVPIADPARLEEAWIARAPVPAATEFPDQLQRVLQSTSWRVTGPLRSAVTALRSGHNGLARYAKRVARKAAATMPEAGASRWTGGEPRPIEPEALPPALAQRRGG